MAGARLHKYDLQICDYAVGNIRQYLDDPPFAAMVEEQVTPPELLCYLTGETDPDAADQKPLLLNDDELHLLVSALRVGPPDLDRKWVPYEALHRRHIHTLKEVQKELSKQAAEDWSRACGRFAERLEGRRLFLADGIEIVRDWVWDLRHLLKAMGAVTYLPRPEGEFPTPMTRTRSSGPRPGSSAAGLGIPRREEDIERMQNAIRDSVKGRTAKTSELIKRARIGRQKGLDALRWLQHDGIYEGFARDRPCRFREGRRNER